MFAVFEGVDGSGKTTVSNRVAERLREAGLGVTHVRAEGKFASSVSEAIRALGRDSRNLELTPSAEFLLYVARDVQLVEQALRPALARSDVVLADRFLYTAEVLARFGRGLPAAYTAPVLEAARRGLVPDLVILVDVDPSLARARRKAHKIEASDLRPPSRKGLAGVGLQHRLRRGYLELAAAEPERWVVIPNDEALDATVATVTALVLDAARAGAPAALERFRATQSVRSTRPEPIASSEQAAARFLAWVDARAEREPRVAAYFLGGLFGAEVDGRRRALAERAPKAVLGALAGLDDAVSWELRERFEAQEPALVARSLAGAARPGERAAALRERLVAAAPLEALASAARLDDARAWALRERLAVEAPEGVVASLGGIDSARAWALREAWLARVAAELEGREELLRAAVRGVFGLDDERAWSLRDRARALSPVCALASIGPLTSERAWTLRERFARHAPKVVMATLRGVAEPRAWALRRAAAPHCKEAIDSLLGLDSAEAWELRETYSDIWPSTVVKSLGPLADADRGRALVARQIARYPENISLLKHATAIALGTHRVLAPAED